MRILVVDADAGKSAKVVDTLGARGHEVVTCFPNDDRMCVGARDSSQCPVESLGCDVTVVFRDPAAAPQLREMGAICASRRHVPLIDSASTGGDIVSAVEGFDTGSRPRLVDLVERRLADLPVVVRLGRVPTVSVRHVGDGLTMTIDLPPGISRDEEDSIVTWAARALRENDPYSLTADVVVHGRRRLA